MRKHLYNILALMSVVIMETEQKLDKLLDEAEDAYRSGDGGDVSNALRDLLIHFDRLGDK